MIDKRIGNLFRDVFDMLTIGKEERFSKYLRNNAKVRVPDKRFNLTLTEFPNDLLQNSNLISLDLSPMDQQRNKINTLPPWIRSLNRLITLNLSNAELMELPREIGEMQSLQTLILGNNALREIPKELGNLKNLEVLDLHNNRIEMIPEEIFFLPKLKYLNLKGNPIQYPPQKILRTGFPRGLFTRGVPLRKVRRWLEGHSHEKFHLLCFYCNGAGTLPNEPGVTCYYCRGETRITNEWVRGKAEQALETSRKIREDAVLLEQLTRLNYEIKSHVDEEADPGRKAHLQKYLEVFDTNTQLIRTRRKKLERLREKIDFLVQDAYFRSKLPVFEDDGRALGMEFVEQALENEIDEILRDIHDLTGKIPGNLGEGHVPGS